MIRSLKLVCVALLFCLAGSLYAIESPQQLRVIRSGNNIVLQWSAVAGVTEYNVYKDIVPEVDLGFPHANTSNTTYTDPLDAGFRYFYVVTAIVPAGTVSGTVTDTSGAPMDGALVWLVKSDDTTQTSFTYTLSNGTYSIPDVATGSWDVCIYKYLNPVQHPSDIMVTENNTTVLNWQFADFAWVQVSGSVSGTWSNTSVYQMLDYIHVDSLNTLIIEEGTTIVGNYPTLAVFNPRRGSTVLARGSKYKPIVFTSNRPQGQRATGDWGGIVLDGNAHSNRGINIAGEGNTGPYSSDQFGLYDNESSGVFAYIRIEYPGFNFTPTNQLNGFAFQGVGRGTEVHHLQTVFGSDDCFEFFGGSVNVSHLVATNPEDDGFDWTEGYDGFAQFVWITQRNDLSDRGIEADGLEQDNNAQPFSNPKLANFTIVGKKGNPNGGSEGDYAMTLRRGTKAKIWNFIVTAGRVAGFDLDDTATSLRAASGAATLNDSLVFRNSIFWDNGSAATEVLDPSTGTGIGDGHFLVENGEYNNAGCAPTAAFPINTIHLAAPIGWQQGEEGTPVNNFHGCGWTGSNASNRIANPMLINPLQPAGMEPNARPAAGSPALNPANAAPSLPAPLVAVPYVGAFSSPTDDWYVGWTNFNP